jgi:hypothetical protein
MRQLSRNCLGKHCIGNNRSETMSEAAPHISEMTPAQRRKARIAGVIGNVVEWYDFALYGYLAVIIGRLFFPTEDPTASLLASYGVFAAGFIMRPFGGCSFWMAGRYDRARTDDADLGRNDGVSDDHAGIAARL